MTSVWREVGDRAWVRRYDALDQTIGVVGGEAGLLVIDTRASHRLADELRDELGQLPGEVVAAVNTHGHWDHVFGNARFRGSPIWGHVRCASMITDRGEEMRTKLIERYTIQADDFREVVLTPPTELLEEEATVDLGNRHVELRYLGLGHTDNDIVVSVPDASVLFVGDLLENAAAPGFGDSYPVAWADTGRAILRLVNGTVVPGHGDPFDRQFAERQVAELERLTEIARDAVSGAIGLDEALKRSPFPPDETKIALWRAQHELADVSE